MKNYKDKFTPEQLERLNQFYVSDTPGRTLPDDITQVFADLFYDEELQEKLSNSKNADKELIENFEQFVLRVIQSEMLTPDVLGEAIKERLTKKDRARIIYNKDTFLTILTKKEAGKHQRELNGQLEFKADENRNLSIYDDNGNQITNEVMGKKIYVKLDVGLLYAVLTGVIEMYKSGYRGKIRINRRRLEEYTGLQFPIPSSEILDFINRGGMEAPEEAIKPEEKELRENIKKHYSNWVDIHNLDRAGMRTASSGVISKLLTFRDYDPIADDIIVESGYCEEEARYLETQKILIEKKNDKAIYKLPVSYNIRGTINSVRNKATKETVYIIEERLSQLQKVPVATRKTQYKYKNKKVKLDIGYADLMKNNNALFVQLIDKNPRRKRDILDRTIFGNEKTKDKYFYLKSTVRDGEREEYKVFIPYLDDVIRKHTVFYKYYFNFHIECDPIKLTEIKKHPLKYGIHITFDAINGDYKDNPTLTAPEVEEV